MSIVRLCQLFLCPANSEKRGAFTSMHASTSCWLTAEKTTSLLQYGRNLPGLSFKWRTGREAFFFFFTQVQTPVTLCSGEWWSILVVRLAHSADPRSRLRHVSCAPSCQQHVGSFWEAWVLGCITRQFCTWLPFTTTHLGLPVPGPADCWSLCHFRFDW